MEMCGLTRAVSETKIKGLILIFYENTYLFRSVRTEPLAVISFQLDFKMVGNVGEQNLNVVTKGTDIPTDAATSGAVHGQIKYRLGLHGHLEEGYRWFKQDFMILISII